MNTLLFLAVLIVLVAGMVALFFFFKKQLQADMQQNQQQFFELIKKQFETEQAESKTELETRKQSIDQTVSSLKEELKQYRAEIKNLEQDRAQKYGNLENELKNAAKATDTLQQTTSKLNNILGNVKIRGQWGERMAEDIIQHSGLIEGVNYTKQKQLGSSQTKPDFTFLLPNDHIINMDVKFPLDNYLRMVNATEELERETYQKEFLKNVKDRVKEIQNREYINPSEKTLDFVLLFIPNEQVYGLIQEMMPELMDLALQQKVVLCSPFTLYAMLSVVRQAYENFRYEKDLKEIIAIIDRFTKNFDTFKTRFEDVGQLLQKLEAKYDDIRDKSYKRLDTNIRHIQQHKTGKKLIEEQDINLIEVDV